MASHRLRILVNIVMKSVSFLFEGTFTRISSVQDERDILK